MPRAPYAGLRILDFSQGIPGPMATMLLSDFGPEVLKIESPAGDLAREHPGYLCWNRNKTRLVLDLESDTGRVRALDLLATADVAVFDHRPGVLESLGLDHATLARVNPALLHVWMPPYGVSRSPLSSLDQDDGLLSALTGTADTQFSYEDRPVWLTSPQIAYGQGAVGALNIAAGLYERHRTGLGQSLVVSGLHGFSAVQPGAVRAGETFREGRGSRGGVPHYQLYRCADGQWFFLATLSPQFFLRALDAIDMIDIMTMDGVDGEFANLLSPPMRDEAIARLDARFAEKPRNEWLRILKDHDVPSGPVGIRDEWIAGETVASNEMRLEFEHPTLGKIAIPGVPAKLLATPGEVRRLLIEGDRAALAPHEPQVDGSGSLPWRGDTPGGPLAGVRVLDLGVVIAGPYGPTIMACLGADVIKVEPPGGDFFRGYGVGFTSYNRGKRSIVLDLRTSEGRDAFSDLVRTSDIVIDNYRLGVRDRLGVDYATLRKANPRIITSSVTGFGTKGALSGNPGFDPLLQALSGLMHAQGGGDEPVFYQTAVNDNASAMISAFGALVALYAREDSGEGQEVQTALANQSVLFQSGEVTTYAGRPANPPGALDCLGISPVQRLYEVADGWIAVSCTEPEQAIRLLNLTEEFMPEEEARAAPADGEMAGRIAERLRSIRRTTALELLRTAGVPAAPAVSNREMFDDPYLLENGVFEDYRDPDYGLIRGIRAYSEWSRTPGGVSGRSAPRLGDHTEEVLREVAHRLRGNAPGPNQEAVRTED